MGEATVGAKGYWSSFGSLAVSPSPGYSLDAGLGRGASGTAPADSRTSWEAGGWLALGPDVSASARHRAYTGAPGAVVDPGRGSIVGETPERETSVTDSAGLAVTAWRGAAGGPLEPAWLQADAGFAYARNALPVALQAPPPPGGGRLPPRPAPGTLRIDDHAFTGALTFGFARSSLAVSRSLHYYDDRYESADPRFSSVPDEVREQLAATARDSLSDTIGGLPEDQLLFTLSQRFSAGWTGSASYGRDRVLDRSGTARTWSAELAWAPLDWLELKAGGSVTRAWERTSRYGTLGLTLTR